MLRLLHLIACEKFIVDHESGTTSAISMLEKISVVIPKGAPEKVLFPLKWVAVALWRREIEVENPTQFSQKIIIRTPENEEALIGENNFVISNANENFRNIINFNGFPITVTGDTNIEIYLKQEGQNEWIKHFAYPVSLERLEEGQIDADENQNTNNIKHQNNNIAIT